VIFLLGSKTRDSFENFQKEKLNSFVLEEKRNNASGVMDRLDIQKEIDALQLHVTHHVKKNVQVSFDPRLLHIVFLKILHNAIKYNNPNGMVKISLGSDGENAIINVVDSGNGIPAEELKNLFKKFFRGTNAEQLEPNGSGLGLFITKNIIDRHGGKIYAESQQGRGTMFKLLIPLKRANIGAENKREE